MPNSVIAVPFVSTVMVRSRTPGRSRCVWSWPTSAVATTCSSSRTAGNMGSPKNGTRSPSPAGRSGIRRTPNVGQRGSRPSVRSKISIAKFDSTPPSTMVASSPVTGFRSVHGSK